MHKVTIALLLVLAAVSINDIYSTGLSVGGESEVSFLPTVFVIFFFIAATYIILRGVQKNK